MRRWKRDGSYLGGGKRMKAPGKRRGERDTVRKKDALLEKKSYPHHLKEGSCQSRKKPDIKEFERKEL